MHGPSKCPSTSIADLSAGERLRAALVPFFAWRALRPDRPRKRIAAQRVLAWRPPSAVRTLANATLAPLHPVRPCGTGTPLRVLKAQHRRPVPLAARSALACDGVRRDRLRMRTQAPAKSTPHLSETRSKFLTRCAEKGTRTHRCGERTWQRIAPLASLRSARVPAGFKSTFSNRSGGIAEMGLRMRGSISPVTCDCCWSFRTSYWEAIRRLVRFDWPRRPKPRKTILDTP